MNHAALAAQITERLIERAVAAPDPVIYFSRVLARLDYLTRNPPPDATAELLKFGHEFGLLDPGMEN